MKKIFAVLALVGVMASCKDKKKEEEKKPEETTTPTTTDPTSTVPTSTESAGDVPKFADADVQKYVDDYTVFVKGYVEAYKSKDMTKIAELSTKASEWSTKSMDISKKLAANPDDATKFTSYITKLSQEMSTAMTGK